MPPRWRPSWRHCRPRPLWASRCPGPTATAASGITTSPPRTNTSYKYSGGFATYPQQHAPIAIYCKEADKTFFVYGGTTARSATDKQELLHMVSYLRPRDRPGAAPAPPAEQAHRRRPRQPDPAGGRPRATSGSSPPRTAPGRPSYIHRSTRPWSIDEFERILRDELLLHAALARAGRRIPVPAHPLRRRQTLGINAARCLFWMTSADGVKWSEPRMLAGIEMGDYQVSWRTASAWPRPSISIPPGRPERPRQHLLSRNRRPRPHLAQRARGAGEAAADRRRTTPPWPTIPAPKGCWSISRT